MKIFRDPLLLIAWLVPVLLFPTVYTPNLKLEWARSSYWWTNASGTTSCYAPIITTLTSSKPAMFFLPAPMRPPVWSSKGEEYPNYDAGEDLYSLNPHWRCWLIWFGCAAGLTAYLRRPPMNNRSICDKVPEMHA